VWFEVNMPIYEYVCNACGHEFEEWQKITDSPVQKCPSCGKRKVERLVSLSAFHLKGSGWYVTDYGKRGGSEGTKAKGKKADKADKTEKAESTAGASASTDKASSSSAPTKD
jgi:putative FmdB family regulatory protein